MARLTEMEAAFLIKVLENIGLMSLLSNNHAQAFPFSCITYVYIICFIYDMYGKIGLVWPYMALKLSRT